MTPSTFWLCSGVNPISLVICATCWARRSGSLRVCTFGLFAAILRCAKLYPNTPPIAAPSTNNSTSHSHAFFRASPFMDALPVPPPAHHHSVAPAPIQTPNSPSPTSPAASNPRASIAPPTLFPPPATPCTAPPAAAPAAVSQSTRRCSVLPVRFPCLESPPSPAPQTTDPATPPRCSATAAPSTFTPDLQ